MSNWTKKFEDDYFNDNFIDNNNFESCPKCGRTYDDADFDFQICHFCGWDAINEKYIKK